MGVIIKGAARDLDSDSCYMAGCQVIIAQAYSFPVRFLYGSGIGLE